MASIHLSLTDEQRALKAGVTEICRRYPGEYWRDLDARREYPEKFVNELTQAGYLGALIPQEYGGAGLPIADGALILETIHANRGGPPALPPAKYLTGSRAPPRRPAPEKKEPPHKPTAGPPPPDPPG